MAEQQERLERSAVMKAFTKLSKHYARFRKFLKPKQIKYGDDKMLFNDWSFAKKVREFKPTPARRRLVAGEQYSVGDEVESFEHMPTWYVAGAA